MANGAKHLGHSFKLASIPVVAQAASLRIVPCSGVTQAGSLRYFFARSALFEIGQQPCSRFVATFVRENTEQTAYGIEIRCARSDLLLQRAARNSITAEAAKQIVVISGNRSRPIGIKRG